ncbi:hypothetical protein CSB62_12500 [Vibrio splendidus]|uniref:DUF1566 domain-containing protein n=1 Tax=Vibrio lentus TaxID=136468 RepID=A0A855IM94_9VIBR|nr:DUF1566 domain-containing protein [Vibrio lentus]PHN85697.1 hypothetical protein CSB62_12500 [Vibrio splendidus]MCB5362069.1 DUF1566 domain-containing protein [Vibrio lentus]MCB5452235.1 DUF1566 domain-containing protein [Vibrio lentus]MCB5464438.1 DUF1566 domain-containing protein [Vibrio lentus]MCC4795074.1 DUF1566 domain-containing protein [Vibrio lentus]
MINPSSIKILKSTMLIIGVLLVGCKENKNLFEKKIEEVENNENVELETHPFPIVTVEMDAFPVNSFIAFEVFVETVAHTSSPERVNITTMPELRLESTAPDILNIPNGERFGLALQEGSVTVYAYFRGVQSRVPLELVILPALTSCGEIDNTQQNNSGGSCLKVRKGRVGESKGKLFTGTPSVSFLTALNYRQKNTADNTGKTYASSSLGLGRNATASAVYGLFRQDGKDATSDGTYGQYDRYCQNLAELHFLDRRDWRRATVSELSALHQESGALFENYGVFNKVDYWTASQPRQGRSDEFSDVGLKKGFVFRSHRTEGLAASCVSVNASHP